MEEMTSFFDCTQPKFLNANKLTKDKTKKKSSNNIMLNKLKKTLEHPKRKSSDNSNLIFPEVPLNPEKNRFIFSHIGTNNKKRKSRNFNSLDAEPQHSKILRPGYSRVIILDKLKIDNDLNSCSSRKSILNKYPKEVTVKNLPLFQNVTNNNIVSINFPSLDNPYKKRTKMLPPVSNSHKQDLKNIILHSICKVKKNNIKNNEVINPELGAICYSSENIRDIRIGSKYCKFPKADGVEEWNTFNNKLQVLYDRDKFEKIKIKKPIVRNCYEYLEYVKKKKHDEFRGKIHETVKEIIRMREKFDKLITDAKNEKFDEWKSNDDD